ncbi:GTPase inhibitor [Coprinopsis cinerea okayama7|uniref:GTPase inhibitor n=1 Tax=Coprinopsis cinerea (strain Okayama-7 / 130 / ATCC MYA-4618 / FGSC 9003) TaxID=240176 RepID=A8NHJ8_COPC7|nr:GTPase inhibitor [Coprinopsis cinerea okayama7\|eukprot:XP_001833778.1 GTPase inhibitor [Coprinopsis cinerea okayama7\
MVNNPNEDTEFNEILRKHGILPPRPKTPETPSPPGSPTFDDLLNESTAAELERLGERLKDEDKIRKAEAQRRRLMTEARRDLRDARFGQVIPISREDYTREVTEASAVDAEDDDNEKGTGVVCFLYKDGLPRSDKAFKHIRALAAKYPRTKFVSIVGDKCIPNLPDVRVPMIIIYRKGEIRNQLVAWGGQRERSQEDLEAVLTASAAIDPSEAIIEEEDDIRLSDDDDEEWDNDPSSRMRSAATSVNARASKNIRGPARKEDDDSDFEFDL